MWHVKVWDPATKQWSAMGHQIDINSTRQVLLEYSDDGRIAKASTKVAEGDICGMAAWPHSFWSWTGTGGQVIPT